MKKILLILASLTLLSAFAKAQSKNERSKSDLKTINGHTVSIKEGSLSSTKLKAPTSSLEANPVAVPNLKDTPTRLIKGSTASTLPKSTPWSALSIAEQINLITQDIAQLRETQTNPLRLQKLEKLLEKKKLQNSLLVAP